MPPNHPGLIVEETYRPNAPLNQFVEVVWVGKADNLKVKASHHAALFTELIFNYGDDFQVEGQNIEEVKNRHDHHIISGLKTAPFETRIAGNYCSIGLILKPFCYGILKEQFGSRDLDRISEVLYESLLETERPDFAPVEAHLKTLFDRAQLDDDLLKFEEYLSTHNLEKGALKEFNLSIAISQKSFIQKFKRHYHLTPGNYIKLKKVNTAIQLLQNRRSEKLVDIGLASGFYDQSHFIKLFKQFSGQTPKEFYNYGLR